MAHPYRLSLTEALFVNINVMIGVGIFVNVLPLTKQVGIFSFAAYLAIGVLLLPLILGMMALLEYHPEGGFYEYGTRELSYKAGFVAAWSYLVGKMASSTLVLSACALFMCELFPSLKCFEISYLFYALLLLILLVNSAGMRFGSFVQKGIVCAKFVPIILGICIGISRIFSFSFVQVSASFFDIITSIPRVLYATSGFETACILSLTIQNPKENAPKAVFFSYAIVIAVAACYQFFSSLVLMEHVSGVTEAQHAFVVMSRAFFIPELQSAVRLIFYLGIVFSAFGSVFGMFYGNMWNVYTLAEHRHLLGSRLLVHKNRFGIPFFCLLIEGMLAIFFFTISSGQIVLLQQCAAIGVSFMLTISMISLFARRLREKSSIILPFLGLINCSFFIGASVYSLFSTNIRAFVLFTCLLFFGLVMLHIMDRKNGKNG